LEAAAAVVTAKFNPIKVIRLPVRNPIGIGEAEISGRRFFFATLKEYGARFMRCICVLCFILLVGSFVVQPPPAAEGTFAFHCCGDPLDFKKLPGTWRIDTLSMCDEKTGKISETASGKVFGLVVSADNKTMTVNLSGIKFWEWTAEYDVKKSPVWVDLTLEFAALDNYPKKQVFKGLLRLDQDNLVIHVGRITRPSDLRQGKGLESLLLKCTRDKAK
jgi:hypothetical protein